jgi:hypothetical protein
MQDDEDREEGKTSKYERFIIHPYSLFRRYWDVSTMLFLFYIVMIVPYRIAFNVEATGFALGLSRLVDAIFIIDIFLNFATGYTLGSAVILKPKKIAYKYMTSFFLIDVISGFPLDLVYNGYVASRCKHIFRLMRLYCFSPPKLQSTRNSTLSRVRNLLVDAEHHRRRASLGALRYMHFPRFTSLGALLYMHFTRSTLLDSLR